jgi:hypothetical protein
MGWNIHQMDVKTSFLNGKIEKEVYLEQPHGFEIHDRTSHVCRLKNFLYGLKQEPRAWYSIIDSYLHRIVFFKGAYPNMYILRSKGDILILVLYVADLFLT